MDIYYLFNINISIIFALTFKKQVFFCSFVCLFAHHTNHHLIKIFVCFCSFCFFLFYLMLFVFNNKLYGYSIFFVLFVLVLVLDYAYKIVCLFMRCFNLFCSLIVFFVFCLFVFFFNFFIYTFVCFNCFILFCFNNVFVFVFLTLNIINIINIKHKHNIYNYKLKIFFSFYF